MSLRIYLIVGVFVGLLLFLISTFFGDSLVTWAETQQFEASIRGQRVIELIVFEPVIFVLSTRPWGPVVGGLAWPAVIIWTLLIVISLVIIAGVDVTGSIDL